MAAVDLDEVSARETAAAIEKAGGQAVALQADTSRSADVDRAVAAAVKALGPLDIMVNNAGILDGYFDVHEMDEQVWRRVLDIDLTGCSSAASAPSRRCCPGRGRIVNMASVAGLNGTGGGAAYVAAKHGVVGLTRQMAVAYSARGITINAVCPGPILTGLREHSQQVPRARDARHEPAGRRGLRRAGAGTRPGRAPRDRGRRRRRRLLPRLRRGRLRDGSHPRRDGGWRAR